MPTPTREPRRRWLERAWDGQAGWTGVLGLALLAPVSALYGLGTGVRNRLYDAGLLRATDAGVPVVSVGNLGVGGSGKTPVAAWIAAEALRRGRRPAILHGGYAADEPELHRRWNAAVPVIVQRDRRDGARQAVAMGADTLILDDGFQHRRLRRDLDIVLVSAEARAPARHLLPRGPWRERESALRRAQLVVVTRNTATPARAQEIAAALGRATGLPVALVALRLSGWRHGGEPSGPPASESLAVAGIARPDRFHETLRAAGIEPARTLWFPDHHDYDREDGRAILRAAGGRAVLTTEKDAVKLERLLPPAILWVLEQSVAVEAGGEALGGALDGVFA